MADLAKDYIEKLTEQVFQNRWAREHKILNEQLTDHLNDHSKRGVLHSGMFYSGVGRLHGTFLLRVLDQVMEQLDLTFRQGGRNDGTFYWDIVNTKLQVLMESKLTYLNSASVDYCARHGARDGTASSVASQGFRQFGDQAHHHIIGQVRELRLRAQVVTMKSAADRKANQVPDVAVMMWFPREDKHGAEAVNRAKEKYAAIEEAVKEATKGLATINKIDDPSLVHKDRISPAVETWLGKSVLVICDLEGNRPNVFYEFGFARAAGTHVIAIRPTGTETDFHLAQWSIDEYANWSELKQKITPRIGTVLSNYDLSGTV